MSQLDSTSVFGSSECERCISDDGLERKDPFGGKCLCSTCVKELQPLVDEWMRHRSRVSTRRLGDEMRSEMHDNPEAANIVQERPDDELAQVREMFSEEQLTQLDRYTTVVVTTRDR